MAQAYYWTGTSWEAISGGGGCVTGPQGPQGNPGLNGESVTVSGPQATQPPGPRKGDIWLVEPARTITTDPPISIIGPTSPAEPPALIIPGGSGGSITNVQGSIAEISTITREEDQ